MRDSIKTFVWYISAAFPCNPPIVEIGSYQPSSQVGYADLRPFFRGREYIGCDVIPGVGVDKIEDVEHLSFPDNSIPTLLCLETLEHVRDPFKAMDEMYRVLSPDGMLLLSSHMWFPVHYTPDYWRFTPQCFKEILLQKFGYKKIYFQGEAKFPHCLVGVAGKCAEYAYKYKIELDRLNSMLPCPYPWPFVDFAGVV